MHPVLIMCISEDTDHHILLTLWYGHHSSFWPHPHRRYSIPMGIALVGALNTRKVGTISDFLHCRHRRLFRYKIGPWTLWIAREAIGSRSIYACRLHWSRVTLKGGSGPLLGKSPNVRVYIVIKLDDRKIFTGATTRSALAKFLWHDCWCVICLR